MDERKAKSDAVHQDQNPNAQKNPGTQRGAEPAQDGQPGQAIQGARDSRDHRGAEQARSEERSREEARVSAAHSPASNDIGWAISQLRVGVKVRRSGWNGKNMFLVFVPGTERAKVTPNTPYDRAGFSEVSIDAHIDMYTSKQTMQPGWAASQADLLSTDWELAT